MFPHNYLIISASTTMVLCLPGWYTHVNAQAFPIMNALRMYRRANKLPAATKATSSYPRVHTQTKIHPVMMYYRQLQERRFVIRCNLIYYQINTLLSRTSFADISRFILHTEVDIASYLDYDLIIRWPECQKQVSRAGTGDYTLQ